VLDRSASEIISDIQGDVGVVLTPDSWLGGDLAIRLLAGTKPRKDPGQLVDLFRSAFKLARDTGKDDWETMALPVLKNRLRDLTAGDFDESNYGFPNLAAMARSYPALLKVVPGKPHESAQFVEPLDDAPAAANVDQSGDERIRMRVRSDLWRAVMDYASGVDFVWDATTGKAREVSNSDIDPLVLPTIDADILGDWRREFAAAAKGLGEADIINDWATLRLGTGALPASARGAWNAFLKDHVEERLRTFFLSSGLPLPLDLMTDVPTASAATHASSLRRLVHNLVDVMTEDELRSITFTAGVLARVRGR